MSQKRDSDFQKIGRQTRRGFIQFIRMLIVGSASLYATYYLFTNEIVNIDQIYRAGIPREIPEWGLYLAVAFVIILIVEVLFFTVYVWLNPAGRRRAGSAYMDDSGQGNYNNDDW